VASNEWIYLGAFFVTVLMTARALVMLVLVGTSLLALGQGVTPPTAAEVRRAAFWKSVGDTSQERFLAASKLKPGRPVDDLQASLLADVYFSANLGGCGGSEIPESKGAYWIFHTRVGYGGTPGPDIRVAKASGATSCKGYKTITDPRVYAKWARR
jgi:hypothetical protein